MFVYHFCKGEQLPWLHFCFFGWRSVSKLGQLFKEKICSRGSKFFFVRVDPIGKEAKINWQSCFLYHPLPIRAPKVPYFSGYKTGFRPSRMTSNNLISPMKFCYNTNSTLPEQCQSSRSVLQDGSRTFGLFWKEKTPSYNRRNTVNGLHGVSPAERLVVQKDQYVIFLRSSKNPMDLEATLRHDWNIVYLNHNATKNNKNHNSTITTAILDRSSAVLDYYWRNQLQGI